MARYDKGHRDTTRRHILDVASTQFRESGIAAVGLAGIMAEAGLTNGAFYTHFASKEDLVRAVLLDALERREQRHKDNLENGVALETVIRDYLSPRHRDRAATGCPTAALVSEIARHPKATREAFTGKMSDILALMAAQMPEGTPAERRRRAIAAYATMVGALQLSRAVSDRQLSEEILENAVEAALALAKGR
ncbi:TetR/AcrR family transcriptional repressor of nem operon [Bradyrhizobium japonicum]|uniref:TetR family transcriptional regulator n=1 Tax=Bradyrhizobium TaxID=374 RepID=UPI00042128A5|nr:MULTISPECIES: TetR family transcriptional regulator [Bradyrhizobium]MBR0882668.1 TetR family transcriptional regulator [Bradyrhizobium liaoningense]MBR0945808.1 TetR family transcriptional regulator [Bradyrhizobium liaoningense]MBR1002913.1 TetR family transcriptional regulator [Bradyrhizobium liaoningense]MBR1031889.1 TetR family transcriptional regulator [Bradyrhizobium liaoningense]MBR1069664.1 TetR family transcriptional regulator [Bradyrhizobium liaoningense]